MYSGGMNHQRTEVWECEHAIEMSALPEAIWSLFRDVASWPQWNAGVAKIEISGPFTAGTCFTMTPTGQDAVTTRLVEVRENVSFLDETRVGDLTVYVDHRIEVIASGRCRVVFSLEAFGPKGEEVGQAVSADFPDVLKALAAQAECVSCQVGG